MIASVTLRFRIPQSALDLYAAAAAAEILGTPATTGKGRYIYTVDCETFDPCEDAIAAEGEAVSHWNRTLRHDLLDVLTQDEVDTFEDALDILIQQEPDDDAHEHRDNYQRAAFGWGRAA